MSSRISPAALYIVQFSDGVVKVGGSQYPERVQGKYSHVARSSKRHVDKMWVSPIHVEAWDNEQELIKWCKSDGGGTPLTREFFSGVSYDDVITFAQSLPQTAPPLTNVVNGELCIDWRTGVASVTVDDISHDVSMSSQTWLAEVLLFVVSSGGDANQFLCSAVLPSLVKAGQMIPPIIQASLYVGSVAWKAQ